MFILKKVLTGILMLTVYKTINVTDTLNFYAKIISVDSQEVIIYVVNQNLSKISFEINNKYVESFNNKLVLKINEIHTSSVSIVASSYNEKVYFSLNSNDNKSITVEDSEYYFGYYLVSYSKNCAIIDTEYNNKITFYNYEKDIVLKDISHFNDNVFPKFKLFRNIDKRYMNAMLCIYVPEDTFKYLPYEFYSYKFAYDILFDNEYYLSLKKIYSLDEDGRNMYLGNENITDKIVFPSYFKYKELSMILLLQIDKINFIFPLNIYINNVLFDNYIKIEECNENVNNYEKEIILF